MRLGAGRFGSTTCAEAWSSLMTLPSAIRHQGLGIGVNTPDNTLELWVEDPTDAQERMLRERYPYEGLRILNGEAPRRWRRSIVRADRVR
jgi:hypothetical protein